MINTNITIKRRKKLNLLGKNFHSMDLLYSRKSVKKTVSVKVKLIVEVNKCEGVVRVFAFFIINNIILRF